MKMKDRNAQLRTALGGLATPQRIKKAANIPAPDKLKQLIHLSLEEPQLIEGKKYGMILTAGGFYESSNKNVF